MGASQTNDTSTWKRKRVSANVNVGESGDLNGREQGSKWTATPMARLEVAAKTVSRACAYVFTCEYARGNPEAIRTAA
ncbi:MAG: hypothetical protein J1F66_00605 [Clostridiales bacterium]|nr:hypothetical protein [Clostridiales bacterium]